MMCITTYGQESLKQQDSTMASTTASSEGGMIEEYNEAYFVLKGLNQGLPPLDTIPNQQTPQATVEYFVMACRENRFAEAARMMNMNLIPARLQASLAEDLAQKLYYVLNYETGINWDKLPDRADGLLTMASGSENMAGKIQRSMMLSSLSLQGRDLEIRLQRVKVGDQQPVWVFSPSTVENIDPLYKVYGPSQVARYLPDWTDLSIVNTPVWKWLIFAIVFAISFVVGSVLRSIAFWICRRSKKPWVMDVANETITPAAVLIGIGIFFVISNLSQKYIGPISSYFNGLLWIAIVAAVSWLLMRIIRYFSNFVAKRHEDGRLSGSPQQDRSYLTYISVAHRALVFLIIIIGGAVILTQFRPLKMLGVSLLSSVGVISIVVGIAAQSTLGNIIAGIQIALTRPVRIGDAVLYENNWGWIEDIAYTYLVIRTWDQRRVIVPLKYFISKPLENWSMKTPGITRSIYLYADYRIDVRKIRNKYEELHKVAKDWDDVMPPIVHVTAVKEETLEIRLLCSAKDSSTSWDLQCWLREEMMRYIVELENGEHLTKRRIKVENFQDATMFPHERVTGHNGSTHHQG